MVFRHGRRIALAAFVAVLLPGTAAEAAIGPQQVEALDRQGATEIIVRREPGLTAAERSDVRADADVTLTRRSTLVDTEVVRADAGELAEAVAELNRDPDVVYAEPVVVQSALSADTYWSSLWGLEAMDVPEAWGAASGAGVTVGVVDTGLLRTHPDLANQLAYNAGEAAVDKRANGIDDDGNGYVDDWNGYDFVTAYPSLSVYEGDSTPGRDSDPQDDHGHGTHVAGTIAAQRDNNQGIAGVAPGAQDHAAAGARHQRLRDQHRDRRGVRLRRPDGPADRQRQPGWRRARPDAALRDPGVSQHALRGRRRQ